MDAVAGVAVAALSHMTVCYRSPMKWLQWNPDRNGIAAVVLALLILVSLFAVVVIYFPDIQQRRANAGFGPDWDCTVQAKGDPVCIKKPGR